jgi:uncharacterized peroxidase-related enzyme
MTQPYRSSLPLLDPSTASEAVAALLARGKKAAGGMLPNMYRAMGHSPALFEAYLHGYELLRTKTRFTPAEQEVVFLVVSYENGCEYCVAAHSLLADTMSKVPREVTEAIRNGTEIPAEYPKLKALAAMTQAALVSRGRPSEADVAAFVDAGYDEAQLLDVFLAISVKTLSNYTNHVFETPLDAVFRAREWKAFQVANRVVQFFRRGAEG